jgi:hypothetical protein
MSRRLDELTRKELVSDVDNWTKDKAKKVRKAVYLGITEDYTIFFRVPSVTAKPATNYTVKIKLVDYPEIAEDKDLSVKEKVRLAIAGDLKISCTCPAFLYFGYKYILTQLDTNESGPEHRFPKIRNPKLHGVMCKHCYTAISAFPLNWTRIAKDIKDENFLRR